MKVNLDHSKLKKLILAMSSVEELTLLITAKAEEIRVLKAAKATKEAITPVVAELLDLKEK